MPLYEFDCAGGHRFSRLRAIAARDDALDCDTCGAPATRTVAAPRLALLSSTQRRAHAVNERSAHEPRRVTRGQSEERARPGAAACGHAHSHASHAHTGRPWMLSH